MNFLVFGYSNYLMFAVSSNAQSSNL